jgi:hypothetical protein
MPDCPNGGRVPLVAENGRSPGLESCGKDPGDKDPGVGKGFDGNPSAWLAGGEKNWGAVGPWVAKPCWVEEPC